MDTSITNTRNNSKNKLRRIVIGVCIVHGKKVLIVQEAKKLNHGRWLFPEGRLRA